MKYDTLILCGSGIKVYALIGALISLKKENYDFIKLIGSSSGSILCFLINIGMTPEEILEYTITSNQLRIDEHITIGKYTITDYIKKCYNFFKYFGMNSSDIIRKSLSQKTVEKGYSKDITFGELNHLTNKVLTITGTSLNDHKTYFFNYITTPDMKVIDAVIISISFPFYFKPVKYTIDNRDHLFVDGGLLENFPLYYYNVSGNVTQEIKYIKSREPVLNDKLDDNVLGLYITDPEYNDRDSYIGFDKITNITEYSTSLMSTILDKIDSYNLQNDDIWDNIINIRLPMKINSMDINITPEIRDQLIECGKNSARNFLEQN
jgi:NTE family protein